MEMSPEIIDIPIVKKMNLKDKKKIINLRYDNAMQSHNIGIRVEPPSKLQ